jgi:hypothetical protein
MPDQTSKKAEVKMYSDFKCPYAYLAFDPGLGRCLRPSKTECASMMSCSGFPASRASALLNSDPTLPG